MREETRQHEGTLTWDLFQSTLIKRFYHIPSKERAASLLNKLQQDPHENIGEYIQRGSEIIQVHLGKTNLKEIAASQYGWNLVQGLTNIPIKNKIADHISLFQSLSDVCKLVKQVKREMENREAFTGISVESEESVEEINWRQSSYNQRRRGNNRGNYRGNYHQTNYGAQGRGNKNGYNSGYSNSGQQTGNSSSVHKVGNTADVQCLLCGLKGHKVTTCRKLPRAQELIKQDKQQYWNKRKGYTKRSANNNATQSQQINEIDEVENQEEGVYDQDYNEIDDINFPTSDLMEEEDQVYYYDDWLNLEHIEEIVNSSVHPQALYRTRSTGHNFIAKVDSGASRNCISKSLWNRIKVNNRLKQPNVILTGAGGSKLSLLGFSEITCSIGRFTFTEEFAVIEGMVSDMLLGIKWEHKFNIHTGWTRNGNHYILRGKHDFISESVNRLKSSPIIKMKGKIELSPESIALVEVQAPRDITGNKKSIESRRLFATRYYSPRLGTFF